MGFFKDYFSGRSRTFAIAGLVGDVLLQGADGNVYKIRASLLSSGSTINTTPVPSANTIDITDVITASDGANDAPIIQISGTVDIENITIPEGISRILQFTAAGGDILISGNIDSLHDSIARLAGMQVVATGTASGATIYPLNYAGKIGNSGANIIVSPAAGTIIGTVAGALINISAAAGGIVSLLADFQMKLRSRDIQLGDTEDADNGTKILLDDAAETLEITAAKGLTLNSSRVGGGYNPDAVNGTPHAIDDDFPGVALDAKWTMLNGGDVNETVSKSLFQLDIQTTNTLVGAELTTPGALRGTDWAIVAKVNRNWAATFQNNTFVYAGVFVKQNDGFSDSFQFWGHSGAECDRISFDSAGENPNPGTLAAYWDSNTSTFIKHGFVYIKVVYDESADTFDTFRSADGAVWVPIETGIAQLADPVNIGIGAFSPDVSDPAIAYIDWVRFYAGGDPGIVGG